MTWDDFGSEIRSVKIIILPRLLYLFLSLPVETPPKLYLENGINISQFIWDKKRP